MKRLSTAAIILALAVLGCKLPGSISGGGSSSSKGTESSGSDPKADVIAASKKFVDLPFFSAKMEGMGQTEIKSQVDYAAPDRYHVKYLGGTGSGMEIIYVGKDSYMKSGDKWSKMPAAGTSIPTLRDSFTDAGLKTLSDVKFEGEDTVDGKPAMLYSYKNVTPVGAYPFTCKIWIGQKTGVPLKIYSEYSNGMLKNMTVNYDTESPVSIEAPVK